MRAQLGDAVGGLTTCEGAVGCPPGSPGSRGHRGSLADHRTRGSRPGAHLDLVVSGNAILAETPTPRRSIWQFVPTSPTVRRREAHGVPRPTEISRAMVRSRLAT
jgi:hypothetical protein